ncbi:hypothetical protein NLJ89_g10836 [Agrocybe chaxingu]|uniref:Uncharacterized protein n=1 Tax=Agrocybe chaxingu TaxID=84603 RepID=A0A9W8JQH6_9AGAR|nr:hypothetical protein NLJ89_g10836 [Agrocybe chaxingu]
MLYKPTIKALRRLLDTNGRIGATPQQLVVLAREWELRFRAQMGQHGMKVDTFNVFCDQLETIFNAIFEVVGDTPTPELEDLLLEKISVDFEALDAFYTPGSIGDA